jgi:hypothetical protein
MPAFVVCYFGWPFFSKRIYDTVQRNFGIHEVAHRSPWHHLLQSPSLPNPTLLEKGLFLHLTSHPPTQKNTKNRRKLFITLAQQKMRLSLSIVRWATFNRIESCTIFQASLSFRPAEALARFFTSPIFRRSFQPITPSTVGSPLYWMMAWKSAKTD